MKGEASEAVAEAVLGRVRALVDDLRRARVPVGLASLVDAAAALAHVDLAARDQVRHALRATLVTRSEDLALFDAFFDARFARPPPPSAPPSAPQPQPGPLRDRIVDALARDDMSALEALADEAVRRHAGFGTASGSSRYRLARTLRALDAGGLAADALRVRRAGGGRDRLADLLDRTDTAAALDRFLAALTGGIQRRTAEEAEGTGDGGVTLDAPVRLEDVEIADASTAELAQLRRAVRPLARRLAARLARRRHRPRGALDVRRTIRRSIGSGGVPLDPAFRRRHPDRPDLWLLCDVSGSVAEHARFTIGLLTAIHDEVPRLRSFLFVDDIVEVTHVLTARRHDLDPFTVVAGSLGKSLGGRRSDWGRVLARFRDDHLGDLTPRSTVLLTGDGRSHDHDPRPDVVARLAERVRGLWLLDPEPADQWATGDSAVPAYHRAGMHVLEVRTLGQLAAAVERILTTPGRVRAS